MAYLEYVFAYNLGPTMKMTKIFWHLISNKNMRMRGKLQTFVTFFLPVAVERHPMLETCGQSYKQFMLIIYKSRVVIWGIFKSGRTLES